jgi:hypothetical protein
MSVAGLARSAGGDAVLPGGATHASQAGAAKPLVALGSDQLWGVLEHDGPPRVL